MRRHLLSWTAVFLLLSSLSAGAALVSVDEARLAGERWLEHRIAQDGAWGEAPEASILDCRPLPDGDRTLGYLLPVSPAGHIIVSPVKEMPAVKVYSTDSAFDPGFGEGYPAMILEVLGASLDFLQEHYGSLAALPADVAPPENRASWEWLLSGVNAPRSFEQVGPLVSADWGQGAPFNGACPQGDGGACLVGCVATSAAMILNHWRYPETGEGDHSYLWGGDDSCGGNTAGAILSAYFGDPYDWDNILDSYSSGYNPTQAAAAAELNYEVAVAFEMDFGHCGSGTYVTMGETVYPEFFRCSESAEWVQRNGHTADSWWALIKEELTALPPRPMHYRITSHSIICDGYREDGGRFYHMNYGWGGGSNAWYALDNLYCPWDGCGYLSEGMVKGIEPLGHFSVLSPQAGDAWYQGDPLPEISWTGSEAGTVVIDLYNGYEFVARLSDWTANDGQETPVGTVDPVWGTGSSFRVKVVGSDMELGWSAPFGVYGEDAWSEASAAPLNDDQRGKGAAWGDCNGNGMPDIYLSNNHDGNHLYGNEGGGLFSDLTSPPLDVHDVCRGAAWADHDNDGDLDLYLARTSGGANILFDNDGAGNFVDASNGPLADASFSLDVAWGDYDNDGLVDLYIVNYFQPDKLLRNEGDGVFSDVTALPLGDSGYGRSARWGDYDNDGDLDLYLVRRFENRLYRNDGGGAFSDVTGASGAVNGREGYGAAWGDYDNDGDLDLYVANKGEANRLYRNDGGLFTDVATGALADAGDTRSLSWADYDNDGLLDLYLSGDGENQLLRNLGSDQFAYATDALLGDAGAGRAAAWADYDGDGDLDLYLANEGQMNRLFRNDSANGNHWLHVDLVGTSANRSGIGAMLHLWSGDQVLMRAVGGDAGYLAGNSLTVEFGLGGSDQIDSLVIAWPGGDSQTLTELLADQAIVVEEADGPTAVDESDAPRFALHENYPNPFNPRTEIRFSLGEEASVDLAIYDLSGRRVRVLSDGQSYRAGTHVLDWDGRDDGGRPLASGVYFGRFRAAGHDESRKMTLLK